MMMQFNRYGIFLDILKWFKTLENGRIKKEIIAFNSEMGYRVIHRGK